MVEQSDLDLLTQAQAGKPDAFHRLIDRHAPSMLRLATTLVPTHHDAEDLLQETFTAAFRALPTFQQRSSVKTWLYAIMFRQASRLRRKIGGKLRGLPEDFPDRAPQSAAGADARLDLQTALAHLPQDARTILILRELDGLSYEEIATLLELPRGTVESRLSRARQSLRDWLLPQNNPKHLP